jgi:hypothetical protein
MNKQELVGSVVRGISSGRYGVVVEAHDTGDMVVKDNITGDVGTFDFWRIQLPGAERQPSNTIEVLTLGL